MAVGIVATMAQHERERISARTKAAPAAAKERGVKLGKQQRAGSARGVAAKVAEADARAAYIAPVLAEMKAAGTVSLHAIARGLNARGIPAVRGGEWSAVQVRRVMARAASATLRSRKRR
jgi:DNA invertase Pin-like site-specific DNA recombinase